MDKRPAIIIGAGPAGTASALFLERRNRSLANDVLLLDKAKHPRHKVCAGGLIPHTLDCLHELDLDLDVPNVPVNSARVEIPRRRVEYAGPELCRVIRRSEFDYSLVRACRDRGVEVRDGERVVQIERVPTGIRIETERETYETPLVIGADGSGSFVRRALIGDRFTGVGKAIMCDVPTSATTWDGFDAGMYEFDFSEVPSGLRGYAWAFPCFIDGVPHVNFGVYAVEAPGSASLLSECLDRLLAKHHASATHVESFPIRWFSARSRLSAPNVLLAGDAAGVDPLMGEGISYTFEYGRRVASVIEPALRGDPSAFQGYASSVHGSWLGRKLRRLNLGVRLFYGPTWPLWFGIAGGSRQLQEIGIRWFNGVDGMDRDGVAALARLLRQRREDRHAGAT